MVFQQIFHRSEREGLSHRRTGDIGVRFDHNKISCGHARVQQRTVKVKWDRRIDIVAEGPPTKKQLDRVRSDRETDIMFRPPNRNGTSLLGPPRTSF